ncbi:MXAN_6577-like cysteine-rich protein [Vulgatibacter sp.]|uniref:MXAN_6577-like cysteine-rich protein n=1 Tax=Vulgatibacter sp. TaxID=1971226 RepID=UPI003564C598
MNWRVLLGAAALVLGLAACGGTEEGSAPVDRTPRCAETDTLCGLSCVDTTTDERHCGACGNVCGDGELCVAGSCELSCPGSQVDCDGSCFDLQSERAHCGACGNACATGETCTAGACEPECPTGQAFCDGSCVVLDTAPDNCGACGTVCAAGEVCSAGSCEPECPTGQAVCEGGCYNLESSGTNCGGCGSTCPSGEVCVDGACATSCLAGFTECDGACRFLDTDRENCGACGNVCGNDELCVTGSCELVCADGLSECDGACRDLTSDRTNCGSCGIACDDGEACVEGSCEATCAGFAQDLCEGACTNLQTDAQNCGACGVGCDAGEVCSAGACAETCAEALDVCGGSCTSLANDPTNCGTCGTSCPALANANPVCTGGSCASICSVGYADCNSDLATSGSDGCEAVLDTDLQHCGACDNACGLPANGTAACTNGSCSIAQCDTGFVDCDGVLDNGCEADINNDVANCGGCGITCGPTQYCAAGTCADPGPGENCSNPIVLTSGANTINWGAIQNDYLTSTPSCVAFGTTDGPDIVLRYDATFSGEVGLTFTDKPTNTRWVAVVSDAACGTLTPQLACISDWAPSSMGGTFNATAGTSYFVHVVDTSSGTAPLSNPLQVLVDEFDCSLRPAPAATVLSPANGATLNTLNPLIEVTFDLPMAADTGTINLTGTLGTNLSFSLPSPNVTVSSNGLLMTIQPGTAFASGEQVTVSWTGLVDSRCRAAAPAPTWSFTLPVTPCSPGSGGMVGSSVTRVPLENLVSGPTEYYVASDGDANGYVYLGGATTLYRKPKAGGMTQNVYDLAGLASSNLGYAMLIDGQNIYTVESKTSGTDGHLFRISSDGGSTWSIQDMASFLTAPADDFRSAGAYGGRIFLLTHEGTSSVDTQIWSIDSAAAVLPDTAVLEVEFGAGSYTNCSGIGVDSASYYVNCRRGTTGDDYAVLRIDRLTGAVTELAVNLPGSTVAMALYAADGNADGIADFIYRKEDVEQGRFVCDLGGASPYVDLHYVFGSGTSNYGLGFDPVANTLWAYDDDSLDFIRIQ